MAAVNAVQTFTSDATLPTAAETVSVGGVTYTWRAAPGAEANAVLIGVDVAASLQNLFDAINRTGLASQYGTATVVNPQVRATAVTATTVVVQAKVPGLIGNNIPSTGGVGHGSWGAAVLAGGLGDASADIAEILSTMQMPANVAQALRELSSDPASV